MCLAHCCMNNVTEVEDSCQQVEEGSLSDRRGRGFPKVENLVRAKHTFLPLTILAFLLVFSLVSRVLLR